MANFGEASSSSSFEPKFSYDIFLSFEGEDTCNTFTDYLYNALCQSGFNTFIDDGGLERGEQISPALLNAIEESRAFIVVFSENFPFSTWCLDVLFKILECKKEKGQMVWPIFYKVEPSYVRHQKKSYGEAMAKHENRFRNDTDKVRKWRSALKEAADLSGSTYETGYEYKFITNIIGEVSAKLHNKHLYVGEHIVGLKSCIEEMKSILDVGSNNDVGMVGIHGIGGIGKTTLAKVLYNLIVDQFDYACFLEFVRERSNSCMGLVNQQEALLSQIFWKKNFNLGNVDEGANIIMHRLCNKRVLLVLDDVDKEEQLKKLAGGCDWFGPGSRIIITTRDKHLLIAHGVEKRYELKGLYDREDLELFCWRAFKRSQPAESYVTICKEIIHYAKGLPLALNVIGLNLRGRGLDAWQSALDQYMRVSDKDIQGVLRVSYDSLEYNQKAIFLDIACFFKGESLEYVEKILDGSDLYAKYNIEVLVDKSLITVNQSGVLGMHDLIQDMGRELVRQDAPSKLGRHCRLCDHKDVLSVLMDNSGTDSVEGIMLDFPQQNEVEWSGDAFEKMNNLRILIVRNARFSTSPKYLPNNLRLLDWEEYPSKSLPLGFYPRKIAVLKLCGSRIRLDKPFQKFENLTHLDFSRSQLITQIPDVSGLPNIKELMLLDCENLIKVHDSVGFLTNLVKLNIAGCTKLKIFPRRIEMTSLKFLNLNFCTGLQHFPEILGKMDFLQYIHAQRTGIKLLPHSIGNLTGLESLYISDNDNLVSLPESIKQLDRLEHLFVWNCKKLRQISGIPSNLLTISADGCTSLTSQSTSVLWSQVLEEVQGLDVIMPRTVIPDWFDYHSKGPDLSFWVRRKFPCFAFAVVVRKITSSPGCGVFLNCFIDGHVIDLRFANSYSKDDKGATFLQIPHTKDIVSNFNSLDWNHVEIKCRDSRELSGPGNTIQECGVYVCKQDMNMEDIRFDCPIPNPKLQSSKISYAKIEKRKSNWGEGPSKPMNSSEDRCQVMSKEKAERPSVVWKVKEKIERSPKKKALQLVIFLLFSFVIWFNVFVYFDEFFL